MGTSEEDLASLNAAADRIRQIVPAQPYIQTIPQDGARWDHHHREAARVWRGQVPFGRDEPPDLQYQTFLYHEHGTDLIHLRIQSPPPRSHDLKSEQIASASSTPRAGPKKKISLADYKSSKSKSAGGDNGKTNPPRSIPDHSITNDKLETRARDFAQADPGSSLKRKRSSDLSAHAQSKADEDNSHDTKRATSPSPRSVASHASDEAMGSPSVPRKRRIDDEDGPVGLPPIPHSPLSSLMPGRLSPLRNLLPDRLSPDLPDSIVAELDRRARLAKTTSPAKREDSMQVDEPEEDDEIDADGEDDTSAIVVQPAREPEPKKEEPVKTNGTMPKPRMLVVKLKIPKRLRGDYRRLLRFPPKPAVRHTTTNDRQSSKVPDKPTVKARDEHDIKRVKREASPENRSRAPKTPLQAPFQSPSVPSRQHATPSSKKVVSTNMARVSSADGQPPSAAATPASSSSISAPNPSTTKPSPSTTSMPTKESEAWAAEAKRFIELGKTLKTAARAHEARDPALALLTNIESFCAFMLSFHAEDRKCQTQNPPTKFALARRTWLTLHGFWRYIWDHTEKYPALRPVVGGLGNVYLARVCAWAAVNIRERERESADAVAALARIGGCRLTVTQARRSWPRTWKKGLADEEEDDRPGKYAGGLEMPVGLGTPTLIAVRTTLAMLEEWRLKETGKAWAPILRMM